MVGTSWATFPRVIATGLTVPSWVEDLTGAWLVLAVGMGVGVGGLLAKRSTHPAGTCGLMMVLAGAAMGLAASACALAGVLGHDQPDTNMRLTILLAFIALTTAGLGQGAAFPYLKRALIVQAGSPGAACAQVMAASLGGVVIGFVGAVCWIGPVAGTLVALAAAALLGLAVGGLLTIFDVGGPSARRTLRLAGVFVVLLALMAGLPTISRDWLRWDRAVVAVREGSWLTVALAGDQDHPRGAAPPRLLQLTPSDHRHAPMQRAIRVVAQLQGRMDRCWLISLGDLAPSLPDAIRCPEMDVGCYDPVVAELFQLLGKAGDSLAAPARSSEPSLRSLRRTRRRYDVIVVSTIPGGHEANLSAWTVESFRRAMARLGPRGILAGLIRPAEFGRAELAALIVTFASIAPNTARGGLVGKGRDQVLVLLAYSDPPPEWHWDAAAQAGLHRIGPLRSFLKIAPGVVPNSLRSPSLARLGTSREDGLQLIRFVSQTVDWRAVVPSATPIPIWPP
jgi:hypothetical protein